MTINIILSDLITLLMIKGIVLSTVLINYSMIINYALRDYLVACKRIMCFIANMSHNKLYVLCLALLTQYRRVQG